MGTVTTKKGWRNAAKRLLLLAALVVAYLAVARYSIDYRIHRAGLPATDTKHDYLVGEDQAAGEPLVYAALGDSLTTGVGVESYAQSYPHLVATSLARQRGRRCELETFAHPGATARDVVADLLDRAVAAKPDVVTVLVGSNDVYLDVPAGDFERDYRRILDRLTKSTTAEIYVVGLPRLGSRGLLLPPYGYYLARRTRSFNGILRELAGELRLAFVDVDAAVSARYPDGDGYFSRDRYHPSAEGYSLFAEAISDALARR